MEHPFRVERWCYRCAYPIITMYRKASYYKVREFEQLQVCVFESANQECLHLKITVDFRNGLIKAFVIEPHSYLAHSFNAQTYELKLVQNFIELRGWRNRCEAYDSIISTGL